LRYNNLIESQAALDLTSRCHFVKYERVALAPLQNVFATNLDCDTHLIVR